MTGLENIITQIKTEAEQRAAELVSEAELEAGAILAQAEEKAARLCADYKKSAEKAANDTMQRMASADDLKEKSGILQKKQQLIASALEKAKKELGEKDYFDFLEKLLAVYAQRTSGEIVLSGTDKQNIGDSFRAVLEKYKLSISDKTIENQKGFILVYGSVEVNCTFDALFDAYSEELSDMLNIALFGGGV